MSNPIKNARARALYERNEARQKFRKVEREFFALLDGKVKPFTNDVFADISTAERKMVMALRDLCRCETMVRIYEGAK